MAQRISFVDILFFVVVIVACVFESETAPTTEPTEKMVDVAVVIDQPCWHYNTYSKRREKYAKYDLLASLLRELVIDNWMVHQKISIRVAIIALKKGTQLEVVKKLDDTDVTTVTEQINVRVEKALREDDGCEDRKHEKNSIANVVMKNFESISGRRPLASKFTVWIHSYEDLDTTETSMWFEVPEAHGRPQVVVLLYQYDNWPTLPIGPSRGWVIMPAVIIDTDGKDFSFDRENQTAGKIKLRSKVENMIDKCSSQRTYDPEKCFYYEAENCQYNVTYGPSPQQGQVEYYCAKGMVVQEECDKNKCDDECFKQTPKETKDCDAACGEKGFVESRPNSNRVQPEFKNCRWIKTECDGPPCGNGPATKRTRSTTSTETTTSVVRTSTTAGGGIESWLVAVIITAALVAVALITGTVFALLCCAKKRRQRRQSAELPQRRDDRGTPPPPPRMPNRDQRRSPRLPPTSMDTRRPPESNRQSRQSQSRDRRRR